MTDPAPRRRFRRTRRTLLVLVLLAAALWAGNSSWLRGGGDGRPEVLAHRGLAQTFSLDGVEADTCTAGRIDPPQHRYVENTLDSMRAAFAAGASMLEFDVQLTADGALAVFHDERLECRTDGTGPVRDHTMDALRRLDLGYGYTADGGATHPLRGRPAGPMPSLEEVLAAFPDRELLVDLKHDDPAEGEALAARLAGLPAARRATIAVYGGDTAVDAVAARLPDLRVTSKKIMKNCLTAYAATGWTGHVPDACHHTELHLPGRYGRFLWGWPNLFTERMAGAGTRVVLTAGDGPWSAGFDRAADLDDVPDGWSGWLWSNRTDVIVPLLPR